jgi:soluble lytic murein transglycosylase-like protein
VDAHLVRAVIRAESNFNPMATSNKGAMGLMQLMPDTARLWEVKNAYDGDQNIAGGVRHLRYLIDRYAGDLDLVLAAYNAGTRPVDAVNRIPNIPETIEYVRRVREFQSYYASTPTGVPKPKLPSVEEILVKLDLPERNLDQVYGRPIVIKDGGWSVRPAALRLQAAVAH